MIFVSYSPMRTRNSTDVCLMRDLVSVGMRLPISFMSVDRIAVLPIMCRELCQKPKHNP